MNFPQYSLFPFTTSSKGRYWLSRLQKKIECNGGLSQAENHMLGNAEPGFGHPKPKISTACCGSVPEAFALVLPSCSLPV